MTARAPKFRAVDALSGQVRAPSTFFRALDDATAQAAQHETLRDRNAELELRVLELTADNESLKQQVAELGRDLLIARSERNTAKAALAVNL